MKTKIIGLCFTVIISGCAIKPITVGENGELGYTINCNSGIEVCQQKSEELCPSGFDIIDHAKKSSTLAPHYGEYPTTIDTESLTIKCK
tara:strand:+ start:229967 stop:230233 length:267 start_codon:yes stop_codon:yes gene_type:complete